MQAPTLLGEERAGTGDDASGVRRRRPRTTRVALDADALRTHAGASPFSWDIDGKYNVVAEWGSSNSAGGRSLILNGHIDVVSPGPPEMWSSPPFVRGATGIGCTAAAPAT